jgi:hypothetical protein
MGGSLAHAPESYKRKELISSQSLLLEGIRGASRTPASAIPYGFPKYCDCSKLLTSRNNLRNLHILFKFARLSSTDRRARLEEQTGEFVNDVSGYLAM